MLKTGVLDLCQVSGGLNCEVGLSNQNEKLKVSRWGMPGEQPSSCSLSYWKKYLESKFN